jgi:hypothetical protein
MTPTQREAAERLIAEMIRPGSTFAEKEAAALLRELLAEPQGEPVATLLEQSRQNCLRNFGPNGLADWIYTDLGELLADAASMAIVCKASEQVQEPVGWLNDIDGEFEHSHKPWMDNPSEEWHPVYAVPQQPMRCPEDGGECGAGGYCRPEPQQRKPLTDDEALALIHATPQEDVTQEGWIRRQRLSWVRAIERAHGIGEQE